MKRFVAIVLALVLVFAMAFTLTGCGSTGECESCYQTTTVKNVTIAGERMKVCSDCESLIRALAAFLS
jgi:uncharacterized lipoprotein YmbA